MNTILFLDAQDLVSCNGLERRVVLPRRHPDNPIFRPEFEWEEGAVFPLTVLYDSQKERWQMWYLIFKSYGMEKENGRGAVETIPPLYLGAYAESTDGLDWYRPVLNLYQHRGSTRNSIIGGYENVYSPVRLPDGHPWKYMRPCYPDGQPKHLFIAVSEDGLHWNRTTKEPVLKGVCDSHRILAGGWDPAIQQYVGYFRPDWTGETYPGRTVGRSTSPDGIHWSKLETILVPDDADPVGTEFYQFYVCRYENQYVGFMNVLHLDRGCRDLSQQVPKGHEQTMDIQLLTSRDGIRWERQNHRAPILPLGPQGSWDDQYVYVSSMVTLGDKLWVYYAGLNVRHHLGDLQKLATTDQFGRKFQGCGGIVEYRLDGFACLTPQFRECVGAATTQPFLLENDRIILNVNASNGLVRVEVCDAESQKALDGFGLDDCIPVLHDSLRATVRWKQSATLANHVGRSIRLRIEMKGRSELYAIRDKIGAR